MSMLKPENTGKHSATPKKQATENRTNTKYRNIS